MAKGNLKGITIEIGGNTAPLNKALSEVNTNSRKLQGELREVNKLLKTDPGNIELTAQKQKLLADAVENSREKLDTLRKAQVQVEEQFKNGAIGEAEYRAFQREVINAEQALNKAEAASRDFGNELENAGTAGNSIKAVNASLETVDNTSEKLQSELREVNKLLEVDPSNVELAAQKQNLLAESVNNSREKLETLKKAQADVEAEFESGDIGTEEYREFQREVIEAEQALNKAEKASADFGDELANTGKDAGSAGDDTEKAGKQAKESGDNAEKGGGGWEKLGTLAAGAGKVTIGAVAAIGTGAVAAGAGIFKLGTEAGQTADDLITLSNQTGIGVEKLQEWEYAARFVDVEVETLTKSMAKQIKSQKAAQDGTKLSVDAYKKLGVEYENADGTLRDSQEVYFEIIDALGKMENETERDATAMQLLGKSAQELNPLIKAGSDELRKLGEEANSAGLVIDESMLEKLGEFDDTMQKTEAQMQGIGKQIAVNFLPSLQTVGSGISSLLTDIGKSLSDGFQPEDIKTIGKSISKKLIEGMKLISEYMPEFLETISAALTELITLIITLIPALLPPLIAAALQLLQGIASALTENAQMIVDVIMHLITSIIEFIITNLPMFIDMGLQIIIALINGIAQALPQIIQAIVDMIPLLIQAIVDNLPLLIEAGINLLLSLVDGLIKAIPQLLNALPTIINALLKGILAAIPQLIEAGIKLLISLVEALPTIIQKIIAVLPKIITSIINALLNNIPLIVQAGIKLIIALVQAMPQIITEIVKAIPLIITSILSAIVGNIDKIILAGVQLFVSIIKGQARFVAEIVKAVPKIITALVGSFKSHLGKMAEIGLNLVQGIWNGISNAGDWLWGKISGFFGGITNRIKSFFGIASPSKLFRDLIGVNLAKGVGVGFEIETPNLQKDIDKNLKAVTSGIESTIDIEKSNLATLPTTQSTASLGGLHFHIDKVENSNNRSVHEFMDDAMEAAEEYIARRGGVFA